MTHPDKTPIGRPCVECRRFTLQKRKDMAVHGFGVCQVSKETAEYRSFEFLHDCPDFKAAEAGVADKRRDWIRAKGRVRCGDV